MSNPSPLIRDIPSIKKTLDDARAFAQVKRAMPLLRPILRLLGVNAEKISEVLANVEDLGRRAEELARIPDRFNDLFAERGWIIYDRMSLEVASAAVIRAETGDLEGAESDIVAYYNVDTVRLGLMTMQAVQASRPRIVLAEKALDDYIAERYHACVPVVLALMDGLVNELHQKAHSTRRGISSVGVNLSAWDSFAAHDRGLNRLVKIFQTGRRRTTTDPISVPYRNGIMHGIDLGYDNRVVAAKTWAALFATREWAIKVEQGQVAPPPVEPEKSWQEQWQELRAGLRRLEENRSDRERLSAWTPRQLEVGRDVAKTGSPEVFREGTPEHKLANYLNYWGKRNYGHMARCLSKSLGPPAHKAPAEIRNAFGGKELLSFEFIAIRDEAPAITEIEVKLVYLEDGKEVRKPHVFRMVSADAEGMLSMAGKTGTEWYVVTWGVW